MTAAAEGFDPTVFMRVVAAVIGTSVHYEFPAELEAVVKTLRTVADLGVDLAENPPSEDPSRFDEVSGTLRAVRVIADDLITRRGGLTADEPTRSES